MPGKHASAIDAESMTVTMDGDPLEQTQVDKARRTVVGWVSRNDLGVSDAEELFKMLGICPSQDEDHVPALGPSNLPNPQN